MTRENYQDQLEDLRAAVDAMAETTLERYTDAVEILESGDDDDAARIIDGDEEINRWYLDIENDCIQLLARQQPVAGDLRFIASTFKIVTDLERIGDLATNLAAYGRDADGRMPRVEELTDIAGVAGEMVADAMDAYTTEDPAAARAVAGRDDDLDRRCRRASEDVVRELVRARVEDIGLEPMVEDASQALLTIRDTERVGDHAVNICARTLYMIESDEELIY
jgi:phosphate transport system protein